MTHRNATIRPAIAAIAAVLALSSTPLLAQTATEGAQPLTTAPPAAPDIAPATTTVIEPSVSDVGDSLAPEPAAPPTKASTSTATQRTARAARPAKAAPPVARETMAAPVAPPLVAPAETVAVESAPAAAIPAAPAPAAEAQDSPLAANAMLMIVGAAGLALIALIFVALAMRRRRRRRDEELLADQQYQAEAAAPVQVDPLFTEAPAAPLTAEPLPAQVAALGAQSVTASAPAGDCGDAAPGSHVEAACEGPTENNPSLSLKKRLKRAHFFDQREFLAEAGEVAPMALDAGLPGAADASEPTPATRESV